MLKTILCKARFMAAVHNIHVYPMIIMHIPSEIGLEQFVSASTKKKSQIILFFHFQYSATYLQGHQHIHFVHICWERSWLHKNLISSSVFLKILLKLITACRKSLGCIRSQINWAGFVSHLLCKIITVNIAKELLKDSSTCWSEYPCSKQSWMSVN